MEIQTENRFLDTVGEKEGGMIWERGIETDILPYVKWEFTARHRDPKAGALWHPRGWDGEEGEREI